MYKNLLESAHEEGITEVTIDVLVQKGDGKILLVENMEGNDPFYHFPIALVKKDETIPQAIQRAVTENTGMEMKEVVRYLGHYDHSGVRHLNFVIEVKDPYSLEGTKKLIYAWLDVQEAVGYPIRDELREILDLYAKI
ncbi:MAG: NUDIX domain-containing protein [Chlamydiia bacterium]|nr:NUDIX domain-containing protein [Chlamydiia bacterium]